MSEEPFIPVAGQLRSNQLKQDCLLSHSKQYFLKSVQQVPGVLFQVNRL